jgi:class 3 adenylate cyclase
VLNPLEKMMNRVDVIRNDPLLAVKMADEEFKQEEKEKAKLRSAKTKHLKHRLLSPFMKFKSCYAPQPQGAVMETVILEKTIIKLGSLLALGFGEAGANIIHQNMEASESAGVDAMIPGERVDAIIGVARIRDFSVATEVLKSKVMTFVNQIAEIVHGVVSEYHGAANKNLGETFMLVWRLSGLDDKMVSRYADFSTIAFARILGAVHRSPLIASYRGHPALQQRLGSNYRVGLSVGLHAGWAIEGAVGSEFKIDPSYLSPNVSISSSVEQATNIYHVPFLVTSSVMELCSPQMSAKFRRIDRLRIRGSTEPLAILCLDLECRQLSVDRFNENRPNVWNSRLRFKTRQFLETEKRHKLDDKQATVDMFMNCQDITKMRRRFSRDFMQTFEMGFANYSEGEWQVARLYLERARQILRAEDGPSAALLRFMEHYNDEAPSWWTGVRDLVDGIVVETPHKGHHPTSP